MPHRVLVVDDEEGVRSLIRDVLARSGVEVHAAGNGAEAMERFAEVDPQVVLLDFLVPGKNGFGIAELIRAAPGGERLPILMMSGVFKNPKTAVEARDKYGVLEFLSKPLDIVKLEQVVQDILRGLPEPGPEASEAPTPAPMFAVSVERQAPGPMRAPTAERPPPRGGTVPARRRTPPRPGTDESPVAAGQDGPRVVDGMLVGRPLPPVADEGDLARFPVAMLLSSLHHDRITGMLDLTDARTHRRVYVVQGRPTFMQSNGEQENVGVLLHQRGRISEHDMARCRRYMSERRRTLQQSLLELRLVSEAELASAYKILAGQLLPLGVGMASGRYAFRATDAFVGRVPEGRFDPIQVVFQGVQKHVHPPQVFALFAGREDVPLYATELRDELEPRFREAFPGAAVLLTRLDGSHSFRSLARSRDLDAAAQLGPLYALLTTGMAALPTVEEDFGVEAAVQRAVAFDDEEADSDIRQRVERYHAQIFSKNFFEIFGVSPDSDQEVVKAAYFDLARMWHVDMFAGRRLGSARPKLDEIFARIAEAYETISDRERRSEYLVFLDRKARGLPTDVSEVLRGEQLFDQALAMVRRRDWPGAKEVLTEAVRLNDDPLYFATLGWVAFNLAPEDDRACMAAVGHLKRALKAQENLPIAYQYLGTIAFRRNQLGEAKKWWQRCLEWDPNNVDASRGLRMISSRSRERGPRSGILDRLRGKRD